MHLPDAVEMLSLQGAVDSVLHALQMYPDDQGWYRWKLGPFLGPFIGCLSSLIPSSSVKVERNTIVIFFYSRNSMPGLTPYRMLDYKEEFLHTDRAPPGKNSCVKFATLSRCS